MPGFAHGDSTPPARSDPSVRAPRPCVLLGLDADRTAHALGIAASGAGGLFAFSSGGRVGAPCPRGMGVRRRRDRGAPCAGAGRPVRRWRSKVPPASSPPTRPDSTSRFSAGPHHRRPTRNEITNTYHKLFSACGHALPAITALLAIRDEIASKLDQVRRIEVRGYKASAALTNPDPSTIGEAKFSLPFITALATALRRRVAAGDDDGGAWSAWRQTPGVSRRRGRGPRHQRRVPSPCEAERSGFTLADGSTVERHVDAPIGMPENPVSTDQVAAKFRRCAEGLLSPTAQDRGPVRDREDVGRDLPGWLVPLDGTTAATDRAAGP